MSQSPRRYVIKAGQLIDGLGNEPVQDAVVVVENDRLLAVGSARQVEVPGDAEVIDASGMTVMPGLIDGHNCITGNHRQFGILRQYLQRGVTTVASFHSNWPDEPYASKLRDAINEGFGRGCARLICGFVVNCTHGHNKGRTADGPWEVRRAVREMVQAGADFIKTAASGGFWRADEGCDNPNYSQEELEAMVQEAHAWNRPVGVHVHSQPGLNKAIDAGVDLIYHGCLIDEQAVRKLAQRAGQVCFLPTLKVTCDRNITAWPDRPWMAAEMRASAQGHREGTRLAIQLGATVGLGTDGPGSTLAWKPGESTMYELSELVACGYTPMQAITAGTSIVARAYRIDKQVGSLVPGLQADLIVFDGNPLENIELMQQRERMAMVMRSGRIESTSPAYASHYQIWDDQ